MSRFLVHHVSSFSSSHRPGYYSGPLMIPPPPKLIGSNNLLFLFEAPIGCLDIEGIMIIPDT